jgi:hypothetical protein
MDEGSRVAWEARFNHDEASALQHAMNLRLQDEAAFHAEYQNDPLPEATALDDELLTAEAIAAKTNGMPRGELPIGTAHLTAFVDVQAQVPLLVRRRVGGRLQRHRRRLRHGARPEVPRGHRVDAARREAHALGGKPARRARGIALRRARARRRAPRRPRVAARRRRDGARVAAPGRRELGLVDGCRLPVLPRDEARGHGDAVARPLRRRVERAVQRLQAPPRRARRPQLAHPDRHAASAPCGT